MLPRYSIIPYGAVTDRELKRRDLQVLCAVGGFTDRDGWCRGKSQSFFARQLGCGRATVQRSLKRLVDRHWAEVISSPDPHECHAYRVLMDRAKKSRVGTIGVDPLPPAVSKDAAMPALSEQGDAHLYAGTYGPEIDLGDGDDVGHGPGPEQLISPEASELAIQIAIAAGLGGIMKLWPAGWQTSPLRVQSWLNQGWTWPLVLAGVQITMRKRGSPPTSVNYFERPIAQAIACFEAVVPETPVQRLEGGTSEKRKPRSKGPSAESKKRFREAHSALEAFLDHEGERSDSRQSGE